MDIPERLPRETGHDYALRALKENIISLSLPPGSLVSENALAAQLGLSRTPVREALMELAKVGIVEIYPQRGSAIALIDYDRVEEARFLRLVLESAVVELDCAMAGREELSQLQSAAALHRFHLENGADAHTLLLADDTFHRALFRAARKELLYEVSQTLAIHFDRVRRLSLLTPGDHRATAEDHQAIVEAISQRDPARARDLMEHHLSRYKVDEKAVRQSFPQYIKG